MAPVSASSLDHIQLFQLPEQKTVLWDHTPSGRSYILHLSAHQNPKAYLKEKLLQWASSCLDSEPSGRAFCNLLGSLSTIGGPSSVGISVNFDQCKGHDNSKFLYGNEITVPVALSRKTKGDYQWDIEEYFSDLKTIHTSCSSMVSLDINQLLKMRITCSFYGIQCNVRMEMATIANSFTATPILPVSMLSTELSDSLAKSKDFTSQTGFLTMDHEKHIVLLPEVEPQLSKIPLVGIWVSGVSSVLHPFVWAACVRYISSVLYKARLCLPPLPFLLVVYHPETYKPTFYDCICDSGNTWPTFSCYEGHTFTDLPKVPVLDSKLLFVDLSKIDDRCKEFEEADKLIERNQMQISPHVIMSNTEDAPQPSHKAPKNFEIMIDPEPQVPDLSFVSDGGRDYTKPSEHATNLKTLPGAFHNHDALQVPKLSPHNNSAHIQLQKYQSDLTGCVKYNSSGNKTGLSNREGPVGHDCVMCYKGNTASSELQDRNKISSMMQDNLLRENMHNNNNFNKYHFDHSASDFNNTVMPKQSAFCRTGFETSSISSQHKVHFNGNFHLTDNCNQPFFNYGNLSHMNYCSEGPSSGNIANLNNPHFANSFPADRNPLRQDVHRNYPISENDAHFVNGEEELPRQRPKPSQVPDYVLSSHNALPTENTHFFSDQTVGNVEHLSESTSKTRMQILPMKSCLKKTSNLQDKMIEETSTSRSQLSNNKPKSNNEKSCPTINNSSRSAAPRTDKSDSKKKTPSKSAAKIPVRVKSGVPVKIRDVSTAESNSKNVDNALVDIVKKQTEVLHTVQDKVLQLLQHQSLPSSNSNGKMLRKSLEDVSQGPNQRKSPKVPNYISTKPVPFKSSSSSVNKNSTKPNLQAKVLQKNDTQDTENVMKTLQQQNEHLYALEKRINELMGIQDNVHFAFQQNDNYSSKKAFDAGNVDASSQALPSNPPEMSVKGDSSCRSPSNVADAIEESCHGEVGDNGRHNLLTKTTSSIATMTSFVAIQKEVEKTHTQNYKRTDDYCSSKNTTNHMKNHPFDDYSRQDSKGISSVHAPVHTEYKEHKNGIFIHKAAGGSKLQSLKVNFGRDSCLSMSVRQKMQMRDHSPEPTIHVDMQDYPESFCNESSDTVCDAGNQHFGGNFHNRCATNTLNLEEQPNKTVYRNLLGNINKILSNQPQGQSDIAEDQVCEQRYPRDCENYTYTDTLPVHERRQINRHHLCRSGTEHISIVQQSCVITTKNCNHNFDQGDINGKLKALAAQYLSDDDSSPCCNLKSNTRKKYPSVHDAGCSELTYYGMTSSSLSFATKRYLENYELTPDICSTERNIENHVGCLDRMQESQSEPTEAGIWVFDKEHRCRGHPNFFPETRVKQLG